jgi:hypothetical protein
VRNLGYRRNGNGSDDGIQMSAADSDDEFAEAERQAALEQETQQPAFLLQKTTVLPQKTTVFPQRTTILPQEPTVLLQEPPALPQEPAVLLQQPIVVPQEPAPQQVQAAQGAHHGLTLQQPLNILPCDGTG